MRKVSLLFAIPVLGLLAAFRGANTPVHVTGQEIHNFRLPNTSGGFTSLADYRDARGFIIVFTCNHCPFAKLYTARLNALSHIFGRLRVPLLAINPMDTTLYGEESMASMRERAHAAGFDFPYLQDAAQVVGKDFHAAHTPAAYVIWKEGEKWTIRYSGAIDDNGQHPEQATPFVANAVSELLSGKAVTQPETVSLGCAINYRK